MHLPGVGGNIRTALLDIDGTLLASNDAHAHAWVDALTEGGFGIPFEHIRPLIGMGADQLLPALNRNLSADAAPGKTIAKRRAEIFRKRYLPDLQPQPGTRALLIALREQNVNLVMATSATEDEVNGLLQAAGIADLVQAASPTSEPAESKPAPDIIRAALSKAGAAAADCVLLGDTRFDISAARKAGVPVIALRCGGAREIELAHAAAIYDDPRALLAAIRAA